MCVDSRVQRKFKGYVLTPNIGYGVTQENSSLVFQMGSSYHLLRDPSFEGDSSSTRVQFSINSNNLLSRNNRSRSSIFPAKECQQVMEKQGSSGEDDNQSLALSYIGSSIQRRGPHEQRNRLFSVLGSLTDLEEEESKDSSEGQVASVDIKLPRRRSYHLLQDPSFEGDSSSTRVQFSINSNNLLSRNNRSRSSIFPAKECQQVMEKQGSSGEDDNQSLALSYIGSSTQRRGPHEQRNRLFSVLGSLTDLEEEESKDSSEGQVASVDIKLPRRRSYHLLQDPSFEGDSSSTRVQFSINSNNLLSRNNRSRSSIFPAKECQQVMEKQGSSGEDDNQSLALSYIGSSTQRRGPHEQRNRLFSVLGSLTDLEEEESKDSSEGQVASVDIKLPRRRSLQVEFSCNSCGERTKRLINRLAYERGLVFVQYDFRKETSKDSSTQRRGPHEQRNRLFSVLGSLTDLEEEESKDSSEGQVASVDIKLPRRRSLQVEFSCNSCGERTKRLINRLAYERGLVFVQCGGCLNS
ncbi:hypothetical protein IGI04_020875 [Brassica rapa subsp. trilocularis]|uniref:DNL-type domain-containing protein n=1 Tax=Brassica rapa subsp. trilocularis TaxID=1813537 RepID=A0ABQ7MJZ4_BRACM|nr:hypothetical protein IGI04_020875 [Brassica rapa subsp. trilocularis]